MHRTYNRQMCSVIYICRWTTCWGEKVTNEWLYLPLSPVSNTKPPRKYPCGLCARIHRYTGWCTLAAFQIHTHEDCEAHECAFHAAFLFLISRFWIMYSHYSRGGKIPLLPWTIQTGTSKGTELLYRCQRGGLLFRNPPDNPSSSFKAGDIPDTFPSLAAKVKAQNVPAWLLSMTRCFDTTNREAFAMSLWGELSAWNYFSPCTLANVELKVAKEWLALCDK